ATHENAHNIEVIQFNPDRSEFDFHEISFKNGSALIQRNAKSCFACHTDRPIWNSYHTWPGVYGSQDDYFFENRMTDEAQKEKFELKEMIEQNQNEYLKVIGLDKNDYYLDVYPD